MPSPLAATISAEVGVAGSLPAGRLRATGKEAMRSKKGAAAAGHAAASAAVEASRAAGNELRHEGLPWVSACFIGPARDGSVTDSRRLDDALADTRRRLRLTPASGGISVAVAMGEQATVEAALVLRPARPQDAAACAAIFDAWVDATDWMPRVHPPAVVERHFRETVLATGR